MEAGDVKQFALEHGADLVAIGTMDRFEGVSPEHDPRFIMPRAKSIIGLGFRIPRGILRGVEEGTQFYQFPEMGIVHIDEIHAPTVLRYVSCYLEDHGYEGTVLRSVPDRRRGEDAGTNPEHHPVFKISYSEAVAPGKPAPDVLMNFNLAAKICGLGEEGFGDIFLTERFGPLQRFAFLLTDAELEADIMRKPSLCDHCGKCLKACPGCAMTEKNLDELQCAAFRLGADGKTNPFLSPETDAKLPHPPGGRYDAELIARCQSVWQDAYPPVRFGYNAALCGIACRRACYAHLEAKGVLKDKFNQPFRKEGKIL